VKTTPKTVQDSVVKVEKLDEKTPEDKLESMCSYSIDVNSGYRQDILAISFSDANL